MIYLDNSATTKVDKEVVKEMMPYFSEKYGNASSVHTMGKEVKKVLDECRQRVAKVLDCSKEEIIFTSSGTESCNLAIKSFSGHIITQKTEHHAVLDSCKFLEEKGIKVSYLDVDEFGIINLEELKEAINEETKLVTIMYANNEIGVIQPIEEIAKICQEKNVKFHTDACQVPNYLKIKVNELGVDLMTLNGSKIYGPKGIGILYVKEGVEVKPLIHGGGQEFGLRSGTENIPYIVGFTKALELSQEKYDVKKLRDKLEEGILKLDKTKLNGQKEKRLPNITNISFTNVEGEKLLQELDKESILASSGSACTSLEKTSHVIVAMGKEFDEAYGAIRFSLGKYNTEKEIDEVLNKIPKIIENSKLS